ncbi:hypothetical protein H6P81_010532 [Aristolochia fimbriata]|uniref:Retrotransposon gag domain-containing protein n=1 Tax=Aristolochia fimbriata TaxID=158543 RepID=A0AAV7ESF4_ARIFI|nr:hypothetical protein H6P81_010532 [Aristolochia fimbriata]
MLQNHYQFSGLANGDPNEHLERFLDLCATFMYNGVLDDAIRLRLFKFTLAGRAKTWLNTLPASSIVTWKDLQKKFLGKYFPPGKTIKLRNKISQFVQELEERLSEAWERINGLLKRCPNHKIELWSQIEIFYNRLNINTRSMIDAASGGSISKKTPEEIHELIEEMTANVYQYPMERSGNKAAGIYKLESSTTMQAQLEALQQQMANRKLVREIYAKLQSMKTMHTEFQSRKESLTLLTSQVNQINRDLYVRPKGALPSNSEVNPKEQVKVITLRSGKTLEEPQPKEQPAIEEEQNQKIEEEQRQERDKISSPASPRKKKAKIEEEERTEEAIEGCLTHSEELEDEDPIMIREIEQLEAENKELEEEIKEQGAQGASKPELKPLPNNLKYVFLEENDKPVIISSCLIYLEEKMLIEVLSKHKKAIGWSISNIKGIRPTICTH